MENIQKLLCEMQVDFICASKNARTNAPSSRITQSHLSAHAPKVYYPCALSRLYYNHAKSCEFSK